MNRLLRHKHLLFTATFLFLMVFFLTNTSKPTVIILQEDADAIKPKQFEEHAKRHWRETRESLTNLSTLGRIVYLNETPPPVDKTKEYEILVWKYGKMIEARHLFQYGPKKLDPFRNCPVSNCRITYADSALKTADIVIFHLHRMKNGLLDLPPLANRNPHQIWTFSTDESPHNTIYSPSKNVKLTDFNSIFNWSMSYRSDSDIPVPYGRTVLRNHVTNASQPQITKRRDVLVAVMGSNCGGSNHRWKYIRELQKHIAIDIYGGCGTLKCPGHFHSDCKQLDDYLFYLSFENSNCAEYFTEKLWWNAFEKGAIPIVMGAPDESYATFLPYRSYLHVDEFANPASLAEYVLHLNKTDEFRELHWWREFYEIYNEHGYFQSDSVYYCRICEALNYNKKERKVYEDLGRFWSVKGQCSAAWDEWTNF